MQPSRQRRVWNQIFSERLWTRQLFSSISPKIGIFSFLWIRCHLPMFFSINESNCNDNNRVIQHCPCSAFVISSTTFSFTYPNIADESRHLVSAYFPLQYYQNYASRVKLWSSSWIRTSLFPNTFTAHTQIRCAIYDYYFILNYE